MVVNNCPSCTNQSFEIVCAKPIELKYKILVVQCVCCKYVIGTLNNEEAEKIIRVIAIKNTQIE